MSEHAAPSAPPAPLERAPEGTPLYVHLPFCAAKCHYCDFFSVPDEGQDVDGMVAAILREAAERAPRAPRTVFIGGGIQHIFSIPWTQQRCVFRFLVAVIICTLYSLHRGIRRRGGTVWAG